MSVKIIPIPKEYRENYDKAFNHGVPFCILDDAIDFLAEQIVCCGIEEIGFIVAGKHEKN